MHGTASGCIYPLDQVPYAPVGLVLGAQVYLSGRPSRFLRARLDLALLLLQRGTVDRLLLSGDAQAPEYDEPTAMRDHLVAAGAPADRLELDPYGLDTYDSCVRARDVYGVQRVVIVTQGYHLPEPSAPPGWSDSTRSGSGIGRSAPARTVSGSTSRGYGAGSATRWRA